jgi:DNA-binding transcriptional MerR regulator
MIRGQFTVADASERLDVNPWTLKRWERLGRIPAARRDPFCGARVYTAEDVERIKEHLTEAEIATTR